MKVVVEAVSSIEKKVVVEVPAEEVDRALDAEYKRIGKTAKVRGFRPGKIPKGLLRKMYRQQAAAGVSEALIRTNLSPAFDEASLEPLAVPDVERDAVLEGQPFRFTLTCQVRPEIALVGIDDLAVERQPTEPEDEAITAELERRRMTQAELEPVEDRPADTGDTVTIDYSGRLAEADEPFEGGVGEDHDVELGSGTLVPGFEDQLVGHNEGDEVEVKLTLPDNYPEELAAKEAVFDVTIKAVRTKVVPDLDDDLAVDLGFEDLGALRADVYDTLKNQAVEEETGRLNETVVRGLLEANPVEVPQALIDEAAERLRQRLSMHFRRQGFPDQLLEYAMSQQESMVAEQAVDLARRDLLLEAVAAEYGIEITDDDIDARIAEMAEAMGDPAPKIRAMLSRGGGIDLMRQEMMRDRALDWLVDKATGTLAVLGESTDGSASDGAELDNGESEGQDTPVAETASDGGGGDSETGTEETSS